MYITVTYLVLDSTVGFKMEGVVTLWVWGQVVTNNVVCFSILQGLKAELQALFEIASDHHKIRGFKVGVSNYLSKIYQAMMRPVKLLDRCLSKNRENDKEHFAEEEGDHKAPEV